MNLIDMHCHILPDVDDGAESMDAALALLQEEKRQGVTACILTPHFRRRMFETPLEVLQDRFQELTRCAEGMGVELYLGCEYHAHMDMAERLQEGFRPTMCQSRYVLTEFSEDTPEREIRDRVRELRQTGYIPIIAHLERYEAMFGDFDFIEDLSDGGCKMQINADSIAGKDGFFLKRFCKKMVQYELLDFVGSDAHDLGSRAPHMQECYRNLCRWASEDYADKIMYHNPLKIIQAGKNQ